MRLEVILAGIIGLAGLFGLSFLAGKFGFLVSEKKRSVVNDAHEEGDKLASKESYYIDLTAEITPNTVVFPGDPIFSTRPISSLGDESFFNLSEMCFGNHTGTHIDFPAHVQKGGKVSDDYSIKDFIGDGLIVDVPENIGSITRSLIMSQPILANDFVFFKTRNSSLSKQGDFTEKFVYIEPDAAKALIEKKVRIVGMDYISVDGFSSEELPVHNILLSNDVLIVENLELKGVEPGRGKFFIMPLNIPGMDGLPARVIMSR